MKYLIAEKQQSQYFFRVHMNETKVSQDGSPNPDYVREYSWSLTPPDGQTEVQYLDNIKIEISLLVEYELVQMIPQPEAPTPLEGF